MFLQCSAPAQSVKPQDSPLEASLFAEMDMSKYALKSDMLQNQMRSLAGRQPSRKRIKTTVTTHGEVGDILELFCKVDDAAVEELLEGKIFERLLQLPDHCNA